MYKTDKYYKTPLERRELYLRHKIFIDKFNTAMHDDIRKWFTEGFRFFVYAIDETNQAITADLIGCCGSQKIPNDKDRERVATLIKSKTTIREVIWDV
jgi:hypothetical protein